MSPGDLVQIGKGQQRWTVRQVHGDGTLTIAGDPSAANFAGGQTQTRRVPASTVHEHPRSVRERMKGQSEDAIMAEIKRLRGK